jgi:hypothetical protein
VALPRISYQLPYPKDFVVPFPSRYVQLRKIRFSCLDVPWPVLVLLFKNKIKQANE